MDACPICQDNNEKKSLCQVSFTYNSVHELSECPNCHVIYCNPIPSSGQFIDFYAIGGYEFDRWKQEAKATSYVKTLKRHASSGKFLDIGCATGYLIEAIARKSEWQVYGVELSERPASFAREVLKLEHITHGDLFDAHYPDAFFDCINISDVLEHVPDPVAFLRECRRILKDDGMIMLGVPNGFNDSRGLIRYYQKYNDAGCHASGHIFFFQRQTFAHLFREVGLKVESARSYGIKNGLRNMGWLPQKKGWENFYRPRSGTEQPQQGEIELVSEKKYPDLYYRYRYLKHFWLSLDGIHDFGLDINFILRPTGP